MPVKAKLLSVESGAVRPLESVTCRWNPGEPNGRKGHFALTDQVKFAAEKQPPRFESSGPAKTIDEEGIDLLIGSL